MKRFIIAAIALGVLFPVAAQASQPLPAKAISETAKPTKAAAYRMERKKISKGKSAAAVKSEKHIKHNRSKRANKHLVH